MNSKPNTLAAEIPVFCSHEAVVPIGELKPHPKNSTKHPPKQIALYVATLRANGWRRPITISRRSGLIVRGHGARLAALDMGVHEVPVEYQDYETEAAELADLVADNRLPEMASTDREMLAAVLKEIGDSPFETGYDEDDLKKLIGEVVPDPEYPIVAKLNEKHDFVVIVSDNLTDFQFLKQLVGVRTERSFKNTSVGEGRVVPFNRFLASLRENIDSLSSKSSVDDDASAPE